MENRKNRFGGAFLAGVITLSWAISAQDESPQGDAIHAYRLLKAAPQLLESPENEETQAFGPRSGSFTHVIYDPTGSNPLFEKFEKADLSVHEQEDGVALTNEVIEKLCELYNDSSENRERVLSLIVYLLAPRYERFMRRALPEAGYILVHQPSVIHGTLFPLERGALTLAKGTRTDLNDMMHNICIGSSCLEEDDLEVIVVMLAHEMAHRVREHIIVEHYYSPATQDGLDDFIRDQEREADRIALLVLQDERYAKAQIKKFIEEIDCPYMVNEAAGTECEVLVNGSATHPSHTERIQNALDFWVELLVKRDGLSVDDAQDEVFAEYQRLISELNLNNSTKQRLIRLF